MDNNFNKGLASSTSIKPSSDAGGKKSSTNENELKSPKKTQLPPKNFMSPTISAAIKASVPKKKILGEKNETLEPVDSFGSKLVRSRVDDVENEFVGKPCLQPYDPVKNYLSPRPKFLRYNPDRRRKILNLQENDDDRVKISTYFEAGGDVPPASELQDSFSEKESDSFSEKESAEETREEESGEDEEEMVEFEEERRCCSVKGFLKFVFVVIAVVLTTQAICSMNGPSTLHTIDSVWGSNHSVNHVYDLKFSEVGYGPLIREPVFLDETTIEEIVELQNEETDDYIQIIHHDEAENVDSNAIQDEILQEEEINKSEVEESDYVEADSVVDDSEADGKNHELRNDAESEILNDMEDGLEKELDETKTNDVQINNKSTSFDIAIAVLVVGHMLLLTSFGAIYRLRLRRRSKKVEKEEFIDLEPTTNPQPVLDEEQFVTNEASSLLQENDVTKWYRGGSRGYQNGTGVRGTLHLPLENDVTKEMSHVHIPSVELLGEFVFGEEISSNVTSAIQTPAVSSSQAEKKQRRKNAEAVTPSAVSVRRSSRLKTRSLVMSP